MASNPGAALLAALSVEVGTDLTKLFKGLRDAEQAVERFNRSSSRRGGSGGIDQTSTAAERAQRTIDFLRRSVEGYGRAAQDAGNKSGRAARDIERASSSADKTKRSLEEARRAAERFGNSAHDAASKVERASRRTEDAFVGVRRVLLQTASILATAFGANRLMEMADDYVTFTNRIRSAGVEGDRLIQTQERLYGIAQRYGVQLTGLGTLYGRIVQAQRELGASDRDVMRAVEGTAAALRLYGAGTQEARGALIQFTQLLGGTRVQMQEYNSINDGARPILQAVANGIDRMGGSIAKLRQEIMSEQGLQVPEFFQGYLRGIGAIEQQAQSLPFTLAQSFEVLGNALTRYTGETDKALGISRMFGAAIRGIGENLDIIMPALAAIVVIMGARLVAALGASALGWLRNTAVMAAHTVATSNLARATVAMNVIMGQTSVRALAAAAGVSRLTMMMNIAGAGAARLGAGLLAAFGGPVGIAIMAIVGAVYLYTSAQAAASEAQANFDRTVRMNNAALAEGNRLLTDTAHRANAAQAATSQLNSATQTGTTFMQRFAGATGDAANALYQQAIQARNARVEMLRLQAQESRTRAQEERERTAPATFLGITQRPGRFSRQARERHESLQRAQQLDQQAAQLEAQATQIERTPPESWVSPNAQTGGRNLAAEIAQARERLAATTNAAAQRELLRTIRTLDRAQSLIRNERVPFDLAIAQAQAENPQRAAPLSQEQRDERREERRLDRQDRSGAGAEQGSRWRTISRPGASRGGGRRVHTGYDIAPRDMEQPGWYPTQPFRIERPRVGRPVTENGVYYPDGLTGNTADVVLQDGTRLTLRHLKELPQATAPGQMLPAGSLAAIAGNTGNARNTETHFHVDAVDANGRRINPERYFAGGTGGPSEGGAFEESMDAARQREDRFQASSRQMLGSILSAQVQQAQEQLARAIQTGMTEEQIGGFLNTLRDLELAQVNSARDEEKRSIERQAASGEIDELQAQELLALNERARTLEQAGAAAQDRQRRDEERRRLSEERTQQAQAEYRLGEEMLQIERDLARTASQRREIERRMLIAQEAYERARLQQIIDNRDATPLDRRMAQRELANLPAAFQGRRSALNQQARDDLLGTAPEGSATAHEQEMATIREQGADRLAIVNEALAQRLILEEEAARRRVEIERQTQDQLRELELNRQLVSVQAAQATAGSLAEIAETLVGRQSRAYRALFIASKAFAIAESIMRIQVALAQALSLPFPANLPAIAQVAAIGASIVSNISSIGAQFDVGGWTGYGPRNQAAGTVHGQEFVVKAGPAAANRPALEAMNAGRNPMAGLRRDGLGGGGGLNVQLHNHAPGVEHEVRQLGPADFEIIARKVVARDAPGVIAADMANPSGRTAKAIRRNTSAQPKRK